MRVLIAGGGIAAIELATELRRHAGEAVTLTLLAPERDFPYRPWTAEAGGDRPAPQRTQLGRIAAALDAELVSDRLSWVDRDARRAHTAEGQVLGYDMLAICVGADARTLYPHAVSVGLARRPGLPELLDAAAEGRRRRLAFVIADRVAWPVALYEVAMTLAALGQSDQLILLTAEAQPLAIFGPPAVATVTQMLEEHGIRVITQARCEVPAADRVLYSRVVSGRRTGPLHELHVDAVVSLPQLVGPHVRGLPGAPHGFLPVDRHCQVRGADGVYACGDATDFAVKHGGIAAQQARVAASAIAARAGAPVTPRAFRPRLEAILASGDDPMRLSAWWAGGHPFAAKAAPMPQGSDRRPVVSHHVDPWLAPFRE